jgi:hypothetical protein
MLIVALSVLGCSLVVGVMLARFCDRYTGNVSGRRRRLLRSFLVLVITCVVFWIFSFTVAGLAEAYFEQKVSALDVSMEASEIREAMKPFEPFTSSTHEISYRFVPEHWDAYATLKGHFDAIFDAILEREVFFGSSNYYEIRIELDSEGKPKEIQHSHPICYFD